MARVEPSTGLKRELGLWDVYAIATGATLSSGFFLLPGLAAAGPAWPPPARDRPCLSAICWRVCCWFRVSSHMGLTKVASVAEEVKDPERNLPLGMFLAFGTAIVVYSVGTTLMVGVVGAANLAGGGGEPELTPVATVAEVLGGWAGSIVMTVAAVLAFASVANAGILSASRYPLAMSRDRLLPGFFKTVGPRGTPPIAIAVTVGLIVLFVTVFDPTHIAELASSFKVVMFALACLAVIVMRESGIESYDPGYRSPFYPWLHILGILAPFWLITQMGLLPMLFTGGLVTFGAMWFNHYARHRVEREGAILHVFERLGRRKNAELDGELRDIMKEKGLRAADPFDEVVAAARVIEAEPDETFSEVSWRAADLISAKTGLPADVLTEGFADHPSLRLMADARGVAVPHVRLDGLRQMHMVLARSEEGLYVYGDPASDEPPSRVRAVFFLAGPNSDPGQHLRFLAQLAGRVDEPTFLEEWMGASDHQKLKEVLLRDERMLAVHVATSEKSQELIGQALRDIRMPEGTLVALVRRGHHVLIPRGGTVPRDDDRLTLIGDAPAIQELRIRFGARD